MLSQAIAMALVLAGCAPDMATSRSAGTGDDTDPQLESGLDPLWHGAPTTDYPEVGFISFDARVCTGTLVGRYTVLTAAHCFYGTHTDVDNPLFLLGASEHDEHARRLVIRSWTIHPDYTPDPTQRVRNDLALVFLQDPVDDVPRPVVGITAPHRRDDLRLVGFGRLRDDVDTSGTKRTGTAIVTGVDAKVFDYRPGGAQQASSCQGDSGGPTFALPSAARRVQVGLMTRGVCGGASTALRLDAYLPWIRAVAGDDLRATSAAPARRPQGKLGPHGSDLVGIERDDVPQAEQPAGDPCSGASSCGACLAQLGCVYCGDDGARGCMTISHATNHTSCRPTSWAFDERDCATLAARMSTGTPTTPSEPPAPEPATPSEPPPPEPTTDDPCATSSTCVDCTDYAGCGYCADDRSCRSGTSAAPTGSSCLAWSWVTADCD